jgi:hypothetical protein
VGRHGPHAAGEGEGNSSGPWHGLHRPSSSLRKSSLPWSACLVVTSQCMCYMAAKTIVAIREMLYEVLDPTEIEGCHQLVELFEWGRPS